MPIGNYINIPRMGMGNMQSILGKMPEQQPRPNILELLRSIGLGNRGNMGEGGVMPQPGTTGLGGMRGNGGEGGVMPQPGSTGIPTQVLIDMILNRGGGGGGRRF